MPFVKGQSGNPEGKRPGTRNKKTEMAEELMRNAAEAIMRVVLDAAQGGDMAAARMILDRLVPIRRGRPVEFDLPKDADVVTTLHGVLTATARGDLTPDEAQSLAAVVETKRRAVETCELETRIAALEAALAERR